MAAVAMAVGATAGTAGAARAVVDKVGEARASRDVRYGDSARAMDTLVDFVCDACREVLGGEAGHLVHC